MPGRPPNPVIDGKKLCPRCGQIKPTDAFSIHHKGKYTGLPFSWCKMCSRSATKRWEQANPDHHIEYRQRVGITRPLENAKDCSTYLGVYVAERALSRFFDNIQRAPRCTPGYDFICGKGFKIDVKGACQIRHSSGYPCWYFNIKQNKVADYFLCLAFDTREDLNPVHVWLIPGTDINCRTGLYIFAGPRSIARWKKYERPLDKVNTCCEEMRSPI